jgi:hypothetical protein
VSRGDTRCVEGRIYEHRPQHDDPELEVDIGECDACEGWGCPVDPYPDDEEEEAAE